MAERTPVVLRGHRMAHVPELRVDPVVLTPVFHASCSMRNCNGQCCAEGVLVDMADKERILAHADLIRKYLEPGMESDASKWFDGVVERDIDFPSGSCEGTSASGRGCVFLDSRGLCTLQKAAMAEGMDKFALKPFYCVAYPLTVDRGVLTVEDADFTNRPTCCSAVDRGALHVTDVCREELEFMLGPDTTNELEQIIRHRP
jgi:Fe-S-cluster containining protein